MKIYFAGSITGGRDDADMYEKIIALLGQYGKVLTEHVGRVNLDSSGEIFAAEVIFERDVAWLTEADWVVAEVTHPSLGVGYELGISEKLGKNVLCLFRENSGRKLSAMIAGNNHYTIATYNDFEDLATIFIKYLSL